MGWDVVMVPSVPPPLRPLLGPVPPCSLAALLQPFATLVCPLQFSREPFITIPRCIRLECLGFDHVVFYTLHLFYV